MLGLEIMSLFLLGLLGAAIPAAGSGDDDDDESGEGSSDPETPAPAAEESEGEAASLLDYATAEEDVTSAAVEQEASAASEPDPWDQEAEDAALEEDPGEEEELAPDAATDLDILAAISRLTAATPPAAAEAAADDPEDAAGLEQQLAGTNIDPPGDTADDSTADDLTDIDEDADAPAQSADDLTATTIVDYQPGTDQIEITIFAPAPDTAVDVVLQQTADGTGTEVLIEGKLRAILDGVLPGDVDANDLYIEFAG